MTNLAIECSGTAGSVALFDGDARIAYADLDPAVGSVRSLAGAVEAIIRERGAPKFLSINNGPGSFTGLRVGLTTAKMLALAWGIPIVPVDTLQVVAWRARGVLLDELKTDLPESTFFVSVINAFRGQVFANAVRFNAVGMLEVIAESTVLDADAWLANPVSSLFDADLSEHDPRSVCVSGPGLRTYPISNSQFRVLAAEFWHPTAIEVAMLGAQRFAACGGTTAELLEPNYIRASAAEEKRQQAKS